MKNVNIRVDQVSLMAASLGNEDLGAAMRLFSVIAASEKPIPASRISVVAQVSPERAATFLDAVDGFFVRLKDGSLSHDCLESRSLPFIARQGTGARESHTVASSIVPTRRIETPVFAQSERPALVSIPKAIFDNGVRIFLDAGKSEAVARSIIAGLLKAWHEADVAYAISETIKQSVAGDPHEYILSILKTKATPKKSRTAPGRSNAPSRDGRLPTATPEMMGVSQRTAELIQEKSKSLFLTIPRTTREKK